MGADDVREGARLDVQAGGEMGELGVVIEEVDAELLAPDRTVLEVGDVGDDRERALAAAADPALDVFHVDASDRALRPQLGPDLDDGDAAAAVAPRQTLSRIFGAP